MTRRARKMLQPAKRKFVPVADALYLAFFKPYGCLSQFTPEPGSDKETLSAFGFPPKVYPIGRLDWNSEGLLLLSDDGDLNFELLNPEKKHRRTYLVQVENMPSQEALRKLESGLVLDGRRTLPAQAGLVEEPALPPRAVPIRFRQSIPTAWISLTLTEGRNHQVRRMTAAVGHPTLRLVRASIGELQLAALGLEPGKWRKLTAVELQDALAD
ncbi:MAG TPA: pseudouridine synthase [Candidatus Obscuribacterales bacterium]